ncbi:MAG: prepilin-type N-terminal cleavage/methylation domain-containing protein [Acidaminococcaceae bacterium]
MSRQKGFTLVELVVGLAILLVLLVSVVPATEGLNHLLGRVQLDLASKMLAMDLGVVQEKALYENKGAQKYKLLLLSNGKGYTIYRQGEPWKAVVFAEQALSRVRLETLVREVSFSNSGAPQKYVVIKVKMEQEAGYWKTVAVQPITGRIVITDETG